MVVQGEVQRDLNGIRHLPERVAEVVPRPQGSTKSAASEELAEDADPLDAGRVVLGPLVLCSGSRQQLLLEVICAFRRQLARSLGMVNASP